MSSIIIKRTWLFSVGEIWGFPLNEIIQNQEEEQLLSIEGFTEEEQQEIREQIDLISGQNKIPVTDELFKINPLKKGGTLPVVINIIGLIAIASSFFFTNRYFQEQEQTMAMEESSYESTEGSVIEELKRQAEEKLNQKEQEIANIQSELQKLDEQSANLKANMESQIKDKELELRNEMEAALAEEKARLQGAGVSTQELERKLVEFQKAKENAFSAEIADFKLQSEAAIKAKEEELAKSIEVANSILEQANRDKAAIETETKKREAELTEQFEAEKKALEEESSAATQKLKELSELQKNEQLIQDQLTGSYTSIIEAIKEGNYSKATLGIKDVRSLLNDPSITKLPSIGKRKNIEFYFLDSLEKEIEQAGVMTATDFTSISNAAELLLTARQNIEYGLAEETNGNQYVAKRFYNEALAKLPQISRAVERLKEIESEERAAKSSEYIALADQSFGSNQFNEAFKQFRAAALGVAPDNIEIIDNAVDGIEKVYDTRKDRLASSYEKDIETLKEESKDAVEKLNTEMQGVREDSLATVEDLNSEIAAAEEELNSLKSDLAEVENTKAGLEADKASLEEKITEANADRESLKGEIDNLTLQIESSDKTIAQLNQNLENSQATIKTLTSDIERADITIETLTEKTSNAVRKANSLEKELNDAVNQIIELIN